MNKQILCKCLSVLLYKVLRRRPLWLIMMHVIRLAETGGEAVWPAGRDSSLTNTFFLK